MNQLLNDIKQSVAKENGYEDWNWLLIDQSHLKAYDDYYDKVCELYADSRSRKAANEAVRSDRERILNHAFRESGGSVGLSLVPAKVIHHTLPFPEEL